MINFRKIIFQLNDLLRGGIISKNIQDIKTIVENPMSELSSSKLVIRKQKLLSHAIKNIPFYKNLIDRNEKLELELFPVIDKNIIRENLSLFLREGEDFNKLNKVVTSGSTGTPFAVYQDVEKRFRNTADTIYFGSLAGYQIGTRLNYLKIWNEVNRKGKIKSWLENILPVDVTKLSDHDIKKIISVFNSTKQKKAFLGYASAFESICSYIDRNDCGLKISNVSSVITMSEGITPNAKKLLAKYFGKIPVSRYSNVENGILAQQLLDDSNYFLVNWASYYIEILDFDKNIPLPLGKSGRIVVTDYFNYAMPIIRYDTGDIGTLDWDNNKQKIVLTKVEGRKMDMVFDTKENLVSSFTITNNMWLYPEIKQYQFIQTDKKSYLFKLNLDMPFEREKELIEDFKKYFGQDAEIIVEYVEEIPLLSSGKRKKVINLMNI